MTWLVTGATGLLGANAVAGLSADNQVVGSARVRPRDPSLEFIESDLTDARDRAGLVGRSGAEVVFHSAALATIEACEANPALAHAINVEASADLAAQAAALGSAFVFISTDAVFDGTRGHYSEDDETSPTSEYGRTKVLAEQAVLTAHPGALVVRVNFYGWSPNGRRSLAEFFFNRLESGVEANGFTDIVVSTLYVGGLVNAIEALVAADASGIFHVVSPQSTSKFEFGQNLAREFGFDPELVQPARSSDHLADARGSRLDLRTEKFAATIGWEPLTQTGGLSELHRAKTNGLREQVRSLSTSNEG